jgi:stringent starvation protein B
MIALCKIYNNKNSRLSMTPINSHLVLAAINWVNHNNCEPYIVADATHPNIEIPTAYIKNNQIVLNVGGEAIGHALVIDETGVRFSARFNGKETFIYLPLASVLAVFPKGMPQHAIGMPPMEADEEITAVPKDTVETPELSKRAAQSGLRIVK